MKKTLHIIILYLYCVNKPCSKQIQLKKQPMEVLKMTLIIILLLIILIIGSLYFFQEKLIFYPDKSERSFQYDFYDNFEEMMIKTSDDKLINALLFKADSTKGLIFYLHGNAGSLESWGTVAKIYTDLNYDVFILDYRGFGKSEGSISSEKQLYEDNQMAYSLMKESYNEDDIIVLGYSIGTGMAAKLASENNPKLLIMQAPFYSFKKMMSNQFYFPTFILKYKFHTNEYLKQCKCPIVIFHGDRDEIVNYKWSLKLKEEFKSKIQLITLHGEGHNGITDNVDYRMELEKVLMK